MKNLIKEIDEEFDESFSVYFLPSGTAGAGFFPEKRWTIPPNKIKDIKSFLHSSILKAVKRAFERIKVEKKIPRECPFDFGFNEALNLKSQKEKEVISELEKEVK